MFLRHMLGFKVPVNFRDKGVTKFWNWVGLRLLPVLMVVSGGISCLLSKNIWFARGIHEEDGAKLTRTPKIRPKRAFFHDKKSHLLFTNGQNGPKMAKDWLEKFFNPWGTITTWENIKTIVANIKLQVFFQIFVFKLPWQNVCILFKFYTFSGFKRPKIDENHVFKGLKGFIHIKEYLFPQFCK